MCDCDGLPLDRCACEPAFERRCQPCPTNDDGEQLATCAGGAAAPVAAPLFWLNEQCADAGDGTLYEVCEPEVVECAPPIACTGNNTCNAGKSLATHPSSRLTRAPLSGTTFSVHELAPGLRGRASLCQVRAGALPASARVRRVPRQRQPAPRFVLCRGRDRGCRSGSVETKGLCGVAAHALLQRTHPSLHAAVQRERRTRRPDVRWHHRRGLPAGRSSTLTRKCPLSHN